MTNLTDAMFTRPPVYASAEDLEILEDLAGRAARSTPGGALLREEVERLSISGEGERAFVRLGTWVAYRDLRSKRERHVRVVQPEAADPEGNQISVLSPLGAALIGLTEGAIFRWAGPDGQVRAIKALRVFDRDPA